MDQGHENKRPRLSAGPSPWPAGPSHHGVSLPHPGTPLTAAHHPHPPPPPSTPYQSSPHSAHPSHPFSRPQDHQLPPPAAAPLPHPHPPQQQHQHFDDRRQHEPERYPPIQDPHQPPPSPAHLHYHSSGYQPPGRDPMVKRDPDHREDNNTLPQLRRPNSTGNGPEQLSLPPPPPHQSHGPHLPQGHLEDRRQMSYDNGPAPMYRHPSYPPPPQTPLPHPSPYEQPMYGPPPGADGLYPIAYTATGGKRKAQRASQACDSCRQLKAKCDEAKPCKNCTDKNMKCVYRDPAPKQQDKATQDILEAMTALENKTTASFHDFTTKMETAFNSLIKRIDPSLDVRALTQLNDLKSIPRAPSPVPESAAEEAVATYDVDISPDVEPRTLDPASYAERIRQMDNEEEIDVPYGKPVRPDQPQFPLDHETPAGRILQWPSVKEVVGPFLAKEGIQFIEDYPKRHEQKRGLLPLFGRGEGLGPQFSERDFGFDHGDIPDDISVGDHPSPSAGGDWGSIGGLSPPASGPIESRSSSLRPDIHLEFDWHKIWGYVDNYKNHIQNMHPLIADKDLEALVAAFCEHVGAKPHSKQPSVANFVSPQDVPLPQHQLENDRKRKRSPVPNGVEQPFPFKRHKPQRSIHHALVLMVLALGKICGVRDRKLPDVQDREPVVAQGSPVVRNGHVTSPNQGSPPSGPQSQSSGLPSPKDHDQPAASRRSSMQAQAPTSAASPAPYRKNYEVIPGLDYFAYATDILGNQLAGSKLAHIHAHILACLYYGQLGRVFESFAHIRHASEVLIDKIYPWMDRLRQSVGRGNTSKRDNKYILAFWTCLQLESDILAELNLTGSRILEFETVMPHPDIESIVNTLGFSKRVILSYMAQLYLRRRLNEIQGLLYDPKHPERQGGATQLSHVEDSLLSHTLWAAPEFRFCFDDPPARDILNARIRAKYYGAAVITYRPFIRKILEFSNTRKHMLASESTMPGSTTAIGDWLPGTEEAPSIPPNATTPREIPADMISKACTGIKALIESTRAFHNLADQRFIITNVFGTAHAQWGNLITLATVYQDPTLGRYVDESLLRELFRRTIDFFRVVAPDSSSLAIDMRILEGLAANLPTRSQLDAGVRHSVSYDSSNTPTIPPSQYSQSTPSDGHHSQATPMEM